MRSCTRASCTVSYAHMYPEHSHCVPANKVDRALFATYSVQVQCQMRDRSSELYDGTRTVSRCWSQAMEELKPQKGTFCAHCGSPRKIRKDGNTPSHKFFSSTNVRTERCPGSEKLPRIVV